MVQIYSNKQTNLRHPGIKITVFQSAIIDQTVQWSVTSIQILVIMRKEVSFKIFIKIKKIKNKIMTTTKENFSPLFLQFKGLLRFNSTSSFASF